jgi:hypothetical protein
LTNGAGGFLPGVPLDLGCLGMTHQMRVGPGRWWMQTRGLGPREETPPHSNAGGSGTFRSRRPRRRRSCKPSVASSLIAARRGRCKAAVGKFNVCNRADIHAYFSDATCTRGIAAIRRNGERKNQ